jgi:hypothetical protein
MTYYDALEKAQAVAYQKIFVAAAGKSRLSKEEMAGIAVRLSAMHKCGPMGAVAIVTGSPRNDGLAEVLVPFGPSRPFTKRGSGWPGRRRWAKPRTHASVEETTALTTVSGMDVLRPTSRAVIVHRGTHQRCSKPTDLTTWRTTDPSRSLGGRTSGLRSAVPSMLSRRASSVQPRSCLPSAPPWRRRQQPS